jgi:hypothetical protein
MRGRIRTVKPELFKDEDLWDLGQETGFPVLQAFEGLWCYADKEGRFEWRPRQLKTDILPYWDGDFSRVLDALATRGFVVKYAVGGREYGLVRTFKKHQVINNRESESEIPPPPDGLATPPIIPPTPTRAPRVNDASTTPLERAPVDWEGKGKEGSGNLASAHEDAERLVRREFARRFEQAEGSMWTRSGDPGVGTLAAWLSSLPGEAAANLGRTLDTFFADPWCRSQHFPIGHLARDAHKYFEPRTLAKVSPQAQLDELDRKQRELMTAGNFGPEYQALCDQAAALRKDLDASRGGEPRRAFGR